jgi:Tol biopolymer transport system component
MRGKLILCLVAVVTAAGAGPAAASLPGANGQIVFVNVPSGDTPGVWTILPDGSGRTQLDDHHFSNGGNPVFSPDRQRIAVSFDGDIYYMNPDGSNLVNVTDSPQGDWKPSWSPDGTRIAVWGDSHEPGIQPSKIVLMSIYGQDRVELADGFMPSWSPDGSQIAFIGWTPGDDGNHDVYTIKVDGTDLTRLTETPGPSSVQETSPDWSPDGSKIAYGYAGSIWTMNADGTGETRVTPGPPGFDPFGSDDFPSWSPDGGRIAFARVTYYEEFCPSGCSLQATDVMTVKPDGSDVQNVTRTLTNASETHPSWESIRPPGPPGYPRPRHTAPIRWSLVPSYAPCMSPNRQHGPPLSFGSCSPPQAASGVLTVGTPEFTGAPAESTGSLRMSVTPGNPATPADEAQVALLMELTDVRRRADFSDYAGELRVTMAMQLTDKLSSTGLTASTAGTVQDAVDLSAVATCVPTTDTEVGSTCSLSTTADALVPGGVTEGKRAVWELKNPVVHDGGADGDADTEPNGVFARPGIFVP